MNLSEIEFIFLKHLKLQPSELWRKPFYEIEYLMEHLKKDNEKESKRQKEEEEKYKKEQGQIGRMQKEMQQMNKNLNLGNMSSGMPSFPNLSNFKI